jgi:hypothetical protein
MTIIAAFAGGFAGGFTAAVSLVLLYGFGLAKGWWVL